MQVHVTFRHVESTEALKKHVEDKLIKLKKYLPDPALAHVILSVEKFRHQCEVVLTSSHFRATAVETSENMYTSIDMAIHKLEGQARKHKEIVKEHKNHLSTHEASVLAEEVFTEATPDESSS